MERNRDINFDLLSEIEGPIWHSPLKIWQLFGFFLQDLLRRSGIHRCAPLPAASPLGLLLQGLEIWRPLSSLLAFEVQPYLLIWFSLQTPGMSYQTVTMILSLISDAGSTSSIRKSTQVSVVHSPHTCPEPWMAVFRICLLSVSGHVLQVQKKKPTSINMSGGNKHFVCSGFNMPFLKCS